MLPTRRQLLAGAGLLAAGACTAKRPLRPTVPSAQDLARASALQREQGLVALYEQALQALSSPDAVLRAVLADHAAHLAALSGSASPTPTATAAPTPPAAPRLPDLRAAERAAAAGHARDAQRAGGACDGQLAALLASIAASESSHAVLL